jgi:hypothetical protein
LLELSSSIKGFLVPRTDTSLVSTPADGLLIYQLTDKTFYYYDVSIPKWKSIGGSYVAGSGITINGNVISSTGDNDWLFNGNDIYNGNTGNVGIGITSPSVSLQLGTTDAIGFPNGTTAQRPASAPSGATRYNTDLGVLEFFNGTVWLNVNTPPIGATYIQWYEAANPNAIYPNTVWVETDIQDGSFIRARGSNANVANGGQLTGTTQPGALIDHSHSGSGTVDNSATLTTSSNGAHLHNWGGWWSNDDSREWINGNGDGVNGNTISDGVFWWGGNPSTVGTYAQGDYSNVNWVIDANGNHSHGGSTGNPNASSGYYFPFDDNLSSNVSTISGAGNSPTRCQIPWDGRHTYGNFMGQLTDACMQHSHTISTDGNHNHNIRLYAHRHWLKQRPTSTDGAHTHTIAPHNHSLTFTLGSPTFISGGNVANESRPVNEAVIFWRRIQ